MIDLMQSLNPEVLVLQGGLAILALIIFMESGCFFAFFLPGDSLLFTAGLLSATGLIPDSLIFVGTVLILAAISGSLVGYYSGKVFGKVIINGKDQWIKRKHIDLTEDYYNRYGMVTVIIGRFLPIVRTFAPIIAGLINAPFPRFFAFNVAGALLWVMALLGLGYWFGQQYPGIKDHLFVVILGIILISLIPALLKLLRTANKVKPV